MTDLKTAARRPVVGVLGGMGPFAGVEFVKNVLKLTPAEKDWDHVHMILDNHPHIPSRTRAVLFDEESPLEGMALACRKLEKWPVDLIAIPCNSACYWHPELQKIIKTPILDIVTVAVDALPAGVKRVASLSGMVPWLKELYRIPLEKSHREFIRIDEEDQNLVAKMIEDAKLAGEATQDMIEKMQGMISDFARKYNLDAVILACTEFSFFASACFSIPFVDSSTALAQRVVDFAVYGKKLDLNVDEIRQFWEKRAEMIEKQQTGILQSTMLTVSEEEALAREQKEKDEFLEPSRPFLNKSMSVMELGCGTGRWTRTLAEYVGHVDAWDYNEKFVELSKSLAANQGLSNISVNCASVEDVPRDRQFDGVISIALLHYLSEVQFESVMDIMMNCVRPGGIAVFRETFGVERRFELHGFYSTVLDTPYHAVYRTPEEIQAKLPGFKVVVEKITLPPTIDKPETCQKLLILVRVL
ncbi:amino acid racemase [Myxococcota bacterium]|nr:amino acid racemase [Myxococcota bacterium]MBU1379530.1 amino acid racemase [Myxococcota bacterium]MBU1498964.1 amino acid racemase [Myxococcota bacterium]